jgi:hypothetical protein
MAERLSTNAENDRTDNLKKMADVVRRRASKRYTSEVGARKTHAVTLVRTRTKEQVLDFMVVREVLEPSTPAL